MIDKDQFRQYVIRAPLQAVNLWSLAAEELLMGTAAQESQLGTYIKQLGSGPALGVFQMEPATHADIHNNFLAYQTRLVKRVGSFVTYKAEDMVTDLRHAVVMARLQYYRRPEPLPDATDIDGQARYWKQHYNTPLGKGTVEEYLRNYQRFVEF